MDDISNGKEKMPVRVLNMLDNERAPLFCYLANGTCNVESLLSGCDWRDLKHSNHSLERERNT